MCNLSIIIPAYNAERYVTRCLKSVFECIDIDNFEIILVDDGSTDHTCELVEQFIHDTKSENIKIVHQQNSRQGAARNHGMRLAQGKYLMFVDVDDYLLPVHFAKYYEIAENNNLDILKFSSQVFNKWGGYTINCESQFAEDKIYTGIETILKNYTIGSVWAAIYNRDFINESNVQFREDIVHEDVEFMLRLLPHAKQISFKSACLYAYCWNEGSTDRSRTRENILRLKKSDIIIATSFKRIADFYPSSLHDIYLKKSNSMVVQHLISLIQNEDNLSLDERMELLQYSILNKIYPMDSYCTLSWKTTLLQLILNQPLIVKRLIKHF